MSKVQNSRKITVVDPVSNETVSLDIVLECKGDNLELVFPEKKYVYHIKSGKVSFDLVVEHQAWLDYWYSLDSSEIEDAQYGKDWFYAQYMINQYGDDWVFGQTKKKRTRKK